MTTDHVTALMAYEHEMFGTESWSAAGYRAELGDTATRSYVAAEDDDGALLGWAGVMVIQDEAQIMTVGVVPAARRRGLGRELLDALLDEARRRQASTVLLEVRVDNTAARELYLRNGFAEVRVRRGYYDHGRVDAVEMHRAL